MDFVQKNHNLYVSGVLTGPGIDDLVQAFLNKTLVTISFWCGQDKETAHEIECRVIGVATYGPGSYELFLDDPERTDATEIMGTGVLSVTYKYDQTGFRTMRGNG